MKELIEKLSKLEQEGISVAIGEPVLMLGNKKRVHMRWSHPDGLGFSHKTTTFDNYADLPKAIEDALSKLRESINERLHGANI